MNAIQRRSALKIIGGVVLRKNNYKKTPNHWNTTQKNVVVDVEKPGKGFKHFLKKKDVIKFLEIIPNWTTLSKGLDAIVLTAGGYDYDGYYNNDGVICIAAWPKEQDLFLYNHYYKAHQKLFNRLRVPAVVKRGGFFCEFSVEQIKAFQLLHVLLHELGHHYDRIKTKSKHRSSRGEAYAEQFAFKNEKQMWIDYQDAFNIVF